MSDLGKYLPLSQRDRHDESGVTSDWSRHLSATLVQLAELLERVGGERLADPSLRPDVEIGAVAVDLVRRLESSRAQRVREFALRLLPGAQTDPGEEGPSYDEVVGRLRQLAAGAASGGQRRHIADLRDAVVAGYDVATSTGMPISIDPIASGAVALARSLTAPTPIRAIVRTRTLVATDAGWKLGTGAAIHGSAASIVLFLFGRAGIPPATMR